MVKALRAAFNRMILMALLATIIVASVSSISIAAPACESLFSDTFEPTSYSETRFSFLPEYVRFVRKSSKDYAADYVYSMSGYPRLKKTEIAMDSANVIDANLNSGRELLNAILNNKTQNKLGGTFIFIDVNNLGWVNKNFTDKTDAGDLYLSKTVGAIQKVVDKDGLIFRLGGDEFGIVMETQDPSQVQKIMKDLQDEIHQRAHSVFLKETQRRVAAFRLAYQKHKKDELSEAEYQALLAEFRIYTSYSQEGVSMGAAYIDGSSAEAIQNRAEKMATEMKIKIKKAFNLDTSKYTGGVNLSDSTQRIQPKFRADIPMIMPLAQYSQAIASQVKTDSTQIIKKNRDVWFSTIPVLKSQRTVDVLRYGQIGIGKYKNELTSEEYKLERYDINDVIIETRPLEVNNNTRFIDARSQAAKTIINQVLDRTERPEGNGKTIWVSLLNLGKLNYFHKKTATGDEALELAADAIRKELSEGLVPFKYHGSDFFILSVGMSKEELESYKKSLEEKLNSDVKLDAIFLREIDYIQDTEKDPILRQKRIEEVRKLMIKKFQVF